MWFELVDGQLIVTPGLKLWHSHAVVGLAAILGAYIEANDLGRLFTTLDTVFGPFDVRRPDLLYVTKQRVKRMDPERAARSKDAELIVEMVNLDADRTDREIKPRQYAKAGIRYYWIVDPQRRTFEAYSLAGKYYRLHVKASGDAIVRAKPFLDLEIPLQELWWEI